MGRAVCAHLFAAASSPSTLAHVAMAIAQVRLRWARRRRQQRTFALDANRWSMLTIILVHREIIGTEGPHGRNRTVSEPAWVIRPVLGLNIC